MSEKVDILVAEDDPNDAFLLQRAFKDAAVATRLGFVSDGQELVDYLQSTAASEGGRTPALLLVDLKMPRMSGFDVLEWRRRHAVLNCIPAVIFSSSLRDEDIERSYALGASLFLSKPSSTTDRADVARFIAKWVTLGRPPLAAAAGFRAAERAHITFGLPVDKPPGS